MGRPKSSPNKKGRAAWVQVQCETCGKTFGRYRRNLKVENFCSPACVVKDHVGEKNPRWRGGNKAWRGPGWRELRESVLERDGRRCVKCGSTDRVEVNHIIPFRRFDSHVEANRPENLETLCLPCHRRVDSLLQGTELAPPPRGRRTIVCVDCGTQFWSQSGTARRCEVCSPRRVRTRPDLIHAAVVPGRAGEVEDLLVAAPDAILN
jgi:5-methylcytosine-specific restriction endonuclease McrA